MDRSRACGSRTLHCRRTRRCGGILPHHAANYFVTALVGPWFFALFCVVLRGKATHVHGEGERLLRRILKRLGVLLWRLYFDPASA